MKKGLSRNKIEVTYGSFTGGDPRSFTPDPDASYEDEIEAWRQACRQFNEADRRGKPLPSLRSPHVNAPECRIRRLPFGMGTQIYGADFTWRPWWRRMIAKFFGHG